MEHWDPQGVQYLETMRNALEEWGLIKFVRDGVIEGWRANLDRYDPDLLFDDPFTLGVTSSRNLINRLVQEVPKDAGLKAAGVVARPEPNSVVLQTPTGLDLRIVKAPPYRSGREPNFVSDFDWDDTAGRRAAAERNLAAYPCPSTHDVRTIPLFQSPLPRASELVKLCRDAFLIWGASSESSLTAGWLGLPTMSANFIAVVDLWRDEPTAATGTDRGTAPAPTGGPTFDSREMPVPVIGIKRTRQPGQS